MAILSHFSDSRPADFTLPGYRIFQRSGGAVESELVVVLSPFPRKQILTRFDFERPVLHVIDASCLYFVSKAVALQEFLLNYLTGVPKIRRVVLIGSSKGAAGALLHGAKLGIARPDLLVDIYAFSPQVRLWPLHQELLSLPSYASLIEQAGLDASLEEDLETHGRIADWATAGSAESTIIYGERNARDRKEAEFLKSKDVNSRIRLHPVPTASHAVITPFIVDCSDRETLRRAIVGVLDRNPNEADISYLRQKEKLDAEVADFYSLRTLNLNMLSLISKRLWKPVCESGL